MNHKQDVIRPGADVGNRNLHPARWDSTAVTNAMQASWFTCSVNEEDFIDNVQANLIPSSLTGSMSSNFNTDDNCSDHVNIAQQYCETPVDATNSATCTCDSVTEAIHDTTDEYPSRPVSPKSKLSLSMHDISAIPSYPLTSKSSHLSSSTIQSQSMTTDASLPKSKDSGFPRSVSCLSLNSNRSYAHVQSKVKEYIRQIKEECEVRKAHNNSSCDVDQETASVDEEPVSVKKLIPMIDKLKDELEDKDKIITKLQENYDELLTRYAAAENRIDYFRINASTSNTPPVNLPSTSAYRRSKTMSDANLLLIPELRGILNRSSSEIDGSCSKKSLKQSSGLSKSSSKVLNPITKFHSSSMRLDYPLTPPSINKVDVESLGCSPLRKEYSKLSNQHSSSPVLVDRSDLETRNRFHKSTSAVKELSPERLNSELAVNSFIKVQRWQESLPSLELIEPSSYGSLSASKSETPSTSYLVNKSTDQSFNNVVSNSYIDAATNEGNLSTNTQSSYFLSRSISQPNYLRGDSKPQNIRNQSSQVGDNTELHTITRSLSFKNVDNSKSHTKQVSPTNISGRHRNLGITENSHLSRKKQIGQKARLILTDYLKNTECYSNYFNVIRSPRVLEKLSSFQGNNGVSVSNQKGSSFDLTTDDRDISLVNCLDEMNQCAQNMKGKSEAITQVLAKHMKDM